MTKSLEERIDALEKKVGGKTLTTRVLVIQDRSGSMVDSISETISGYNEYVDNLAKDDSDEAFLTLVQFDDRYEVKEENTPVKKVKALDETTFVPRGMTALLDAVGKGVSEFKRTLGDKDRALVVIMTDGGENASREWNKQRVAKLIRDCEDTDRFTFLFLGAGQDSWGGYQQLGLRRNQAVAFGNTPFEKEAAYSALTSTTRGFRSSGAMVMDHSGEAVADAMFEAGAEVQSAESTPLGTPGSEQDEKPED